MPPGIENHTEALHSSRPEHDPSDEHTPTRKRVFQRGYLACNRCRSRKVKCVLEGDPPCAKCRREHRECLFPTGRQNHRQREPPSWTQATGGSIASADDDSPTEPAAHLYHQQRASRPVQPAKNGRTTPERLSLMEKAMHTVIPEPGNGGFEGFLDSPRPLQNASSEPTSLLEGGRLARTGSNSNFENPSNTFMSISPFSIVPHLSSVDSKTLSLWSRCRFVRQGLLTAQEAVTLIDLYGSFLWVGSAAYLTRFHEYLGHLSPVPTQEYRDHRDHHRLVHEEPMLCSTLLMISSRFFAFSGLGGPMRAYFLHQRLWQFCERWIRRIIFGQQNYVMTKTMIVGTIESFLLISDWHPRSINFPPEEEGWDQDFLVSRSPSPEPQMTSGKSASVRWKDDILEPAKRSDHMCWMLLGTATNLAAEFGLFADDLGLVKPDVREETRRLRIRKLLYVYVTNLAVRLGCPNGLPQNLISNILPSPRNPMSGPEFHRQKDLGQFLELWLDLVELTKVASEIFFQSAPQSKRQLLSGAYVGLLQHFVPSLTKWRERFTVNSSEISSGLKDLLLIEYYIIRVYTHALSIQAIVERARIRGNSGPQQIQDNNCFLPQDSEFVEEVISSSSEILKISTKLALSGRLRYTPARQSLCVISSCIFLLKALSVGASNNSVRGALDLLDQYITALRSSPIDDMDFSFRFVTLVEKHVSQFRSRSGAPLSDSEVRDPHSVGVNQSMDSGPPNQGPSDIFQQIQTPSAGMDQAVIEGADTDTWWTRPLDGIAPFAAWGESISGGLELDTMDFLWNLPTEQ